MKKVLIILFYWPPSGGSSVQRWLHFANYLPDHGWTPVIYAPENAQYPESDFTLEDLIRPGTRVIKNKIFEPYGFYRKFSGIPKDKNLAAGMTLPKKPTMAARIKNNISIWIRGNFFIPDARMLWIRPSVRFLSRHLKSEHFDAIVTTGPPHSLHLIGYHLHRKTHIPWMADFRDPWTRIDFYSELKLTGLADRYHHLLETRVLQSANEVVTIGEEMKEEFIAKGAKKVSVITNGYDEGDILAGIATPDKKFSLLHIGTFSRTRNSQALWQALSEIVKEIPQFAEDLEIKLVGNVDFSVFQSIDDNGLGKFLKHLDYLPHPEAIKAARSAQLLLLMINDSENARGILTGKFFEYLASGRPILLIGPEDGDAAKILTETASGAAADFNDDSAIADIIIRYYRQYLQGTLVVDGQGIESYSRRKLTEKLARVLDEMVR